MANKIRRASDHIFSGRKFVQVPTEYGWNELLGSWKCRWGVWVGLGLLVLLACFRKIFADGWFWAGAWVPAIPAIMSFVLMNFTGASTYTSLSGVKREMRVAVPIQLVCIVVGGVFWFLNLFF